MANSTLAITLVLLIIALLWLIKLHREKRQLTARLAETGQRLEQAGRALTALRQSQQQSRPFDENLGAAQLTTRLQQPRLAGGGDVPERYRYIRPLACRGLSAEEISAVLAISTREAEQLVELSRMARQPLDAAG